MLLLPLFLACKSPDPAPTRLEELIGWMFTHADVEDQAVLDEGTANLSAWMGNHFNATLEGYEVDTLTAEQLAVIGEEDRDLDGLQGVAVGYPFSTDADQIARALMANRESDNADPDGLNSSTVIEGSYEGFADGSEDWAVIDANVVSDIGFGITLETWIRYQYRRYESEAGTVLLQRAWSQRTPEISTSLFSIEQTYLIWVLVPDGDSWRSIQGEWVDAEVLTGNLNVDFVLQQWVKGLIENEAGLDASAAEF